MANENDWFAPKRFGYGAGMPIAWQGWALIGAFAVGMVAAGLLLGQHHPLLFATLVFAMTVPLIVVSAQHTRGGWRWRWGEE